MDLSNGYMVLDVETTGLDPRHDRIVEVGVGLALPGDHGQPGPGLRVQSWLVRDWAHAISPESTAVHGIHMWEAERLGIAMAEVMVTIERAWFAELPVVAHNGFRFDLPFILEAFTLGETPMFIGPEWWIDTAALYKGYMMGLKPRPGETHKGYAARVLDQRVYGLKYNLEVACADLGVPPLGPDEPAHRTSADVKQTARLFEALLSRGVRIDGEDL